MAPIFPWCVCADLYMERLLYIPFSVNCILRTFFLVRYSESVTLRTVKTSPNVSNGNMLRHCYILVIYTTIHIFRLYLYNSSTTIIPWFIGCHGKVSVMAAKIWQLFFHGKSFVCYGFLRKKAIFPWICINTIWLYLHGKAIIFPWSGRLKNLFMKWFILLHGKAYVCSFFYIYMERQIDTPSHYLDCRTRSTLAI